MEDRFREQTVEIEGIAKRLGVEVQRLGEEAAIKPETMRKIARGYQKASARMMDSIRLVEKRLRRPGTSDSIHENKIVSVPAIKVPVISWAAAGEAHDYADLTHQIEDTVLTYCRDSNAFALIVEGDSMESEIHAGDIVVFSPSNEPRNGDIVVARLEEGHGVLLKRFRRIGQEGKTIRLESSNPQYPVKEFPEKAFSFIFPAVELKRMLRR